MLTWQEGKNRIFTKVISLVIAQAFLFTTVVYPAPSERSLFKNKKVDYKKIQEQREETLQQKKDTLSGKIKSKKSIYNQDKGDLTHRIKLSSLKDLSSIYIPDSLGRVVEVYQGTKDRGQEARPLVVHIQDLHTNPEAQYNEASILEILIKDYDLGLVCSEGAEGEVDTSSVSSFPDPEVREKTARLFVNSGELTAEEYLSITKYPDLPIWGIEDKNIYFQNIIEYNKIMKFSPEAQVFIGQVKEVLETLKPEIYSKKLLEIDAKETEYEENKIETNEYLDYLLDLCSRFGLEHEKYKNIAILRETLEFEKKIDQQKIMQESQRLLVNLQEILSEKGNKSEIETLLAKASLFKDQKISPFSFYSYLDELARRHLKYDLEKYRDLLDFVMYLEKVNSLDSIKLFQEIEEFTYETKDFISTNEDQKRLTKALRHIKFLQNFFNLKVSNEELDYYLANKEDFKVSWFKSTTTDLTPRLRSGQADKRTNGQTNYIDFNPDLIDIHLSELEHFYQIAKERDMAMVDNAVSEIEKRNVKVSALVAGGFHTRGLTQLLKEKGYSYVVISPYSSTEIDEENYQFLLSGKRKPLSELIDQLNGKLRPPMRFDPGLQEELDAILRQPRAPDGKFAKKAVGNPEDTMDTIIGSPRLLTLASRGLLTIREYRKVEGRVSESTTRRDFKTLVDIGYLQPDTHGDFQTLLELGHLEEDNTIKGRKYRLTGEGRERYGIFPNRTPYNLATKLESMVAYPREVISIDEASKEQETLIRNIAESLRNIKQPVVFVFDIDETLVDSKDQPKVIYFKELLEALRSIDNVIVGIVSQRPILVGGGLVKDDTATGSIQYKEIEEALATLGIKIDDFDFFAGGLLSEKGLILNEGGSEAYGIGYFRVRKDKKEKAMVEKLESVEIVDQKWKWSKIALLSYIDEIFTSMGLDNFEGAHIFTIGDDVIQDHSMIHGSPMISEHTGFVEERINVEQVQKILGRIGNVVSILVPRIKNKNRISFFNSQWPFEFVVSNLDIETDAFYFDIAGAIAKQIENLETNSEMAEAVPEIPKLIILRKGGKFDWDALKLEMDELQKSGETARLSRTYRAKTVLDILDLKEGDVYLDLAGGPGTYTLVASDYYKVKEAIYLDISKLNLFLAEHLFRNLKNLTAEEKRDILLKAGYSTNILNIFMKLSKREGIEHSLPKNVKLILGDATDMRDKVETDSVTKLSITELFRWLGEKGTEDCIKEMLRVVKPGGRIFIVYDFTEKAKLGNFEKAFRAIAEQNRVDIDFRKDTNSGIEGAFIVDIIRKSSDAFRVAAEEGEEEDAIEGIGRYFIESVGYNPQQKVLVATVVDLESSRDETNTIWIRAERSPPGYLDNTLQDLKRLTSANRIADEIMDWYVTEFQYRIKGKTYILEDNKYAILGLGSKDIVAISRRLANNPVALFHEIAHAYLHHHPERIVDIRNILAEGRKQWIDSKDRDIFYRTSRSIRNHYVLRAFQRQIFENQDIYLTELIKNITQELKGVGDGRLFSLGSELIEVEKLFPLAEALEKSLKKVKDKRAKELLEGGLVLVPNSDALDKLKEGVLDVFIKDASAREEIAHIVIWPLKHGSGSYYKKAVYLKWFGITPKWMQGKGVCGPALYRALFGFLYSSGYREIYGVINKDMGDFWEIRGWRPAERPMYTPHKRGYYIEEPWDLKGQCSTAKDLYIGELGVDIRIRQKEETKKSIRKYIRRLKIAGLFIIAFSMLYVGYRQFDAPKEAREIFRDIRGPLTSARVYEDPEAQHRNEVFEIRKLQVNDKNLLNEKETARVERFLNARRIEAVNFAARKFNLEPEVIAAFLYEEKIYIESHNRLRYALREWLSEGIFPHTTSHKSTVGQGQVDESYLFNRKFLRLLYEDREHFLDRIRIRDDKSSFKTFIDIHETWDMPEVDDETYLGHMTAGLGKHRILGFLDIEDIDIFLVGSAMREMATDIAKRNVGVTAIPDMAILLEHSKDWLVKEYKEIPLGKTKYGDLYNRFGISFGGIEYYHALMRYFALARHYSGVELAYLRGRAKVNAYLMFLRSGVFKVFKEEDFQGADITASLLLPVAPLVASFGKKGQGPPSDLAARVEENVKELRSRWESNPDSFIVKSGQEGVDWVLKRMEDDPKCYIGFGDMIKIALYSFTKEIVDRLIPIMVGATNIILEKHRSAAGNVGGAVSISGDEATLVLPSDLSPEEVNNIRLELQATLASFIADRYAFVKVKGVTDKNMEDINEGLGTDGLTGVYKDRDGFFMVFDKTKPFTDKVEMVGRPFEIPSPRSSFGIVRASTKHKDVNANYGISIRHAEYVRNIANENGWHGATREVLGELDKFDEDTEEPTIPRLSNEERRKIADNYRRLGIELYFDQIEEYYPVVKREYLYYVIQQMPGTPIGSTVLVRGPPDNFYAVTKTDNGTIRFIKLELVYEPYGELKKSVDSAIKNARYTGEDLRQRWPEQDFYGFKMINEFYDHGVANKVILEESNILDSILSENGRDIMDVADEIARRINNEIKNTGVKAKVRVVLNCMRVDAKNIHGGLIDDIDNMAKVTEGFTMVETDKKNIVKIFDESKKSEFEKAVRKNRVNERKKFLPILYDAYSKPVLNEKDLDRHALFPRKIDEKFESLLTCLEDSKNAFKPDMFIDRFKELEVALALSEPSILNSFKSEIIDNLPQKVKVKIAHYIERFKEKDVYLPNLRWFFEMTDKALKSDDQEAEDYIEITGDEKRNVVMRLKEHLAPSDFQYTDFADVSIIRDKSGANYIALESIENKDKNEIKRERLAYKLGKGRAPLTEIKVTRVTNIDAPATLSRLVTDYMNDKDAFKRFQKGSIESLIVFYTFIRDVDHEFGEKSSFWKPGEQDICISFDHGSAFNSLIYSIIPGKSVYDIKDFIEEYQWSFIFNVNFPYKIDYDILKEKVVEFMSIADDEIRNSVYNAGFYSYEAQRMIDAVIEWRDNLDSDLEKLILQATGVKVDLSEAKIDDTFRTRAKTTPLLEKNRTKSSL